MSNNLQQIITEMQILIGSKTRFIAVDISKYLDEDYTKRIKISQINFLSSFPRYALEMLIIFDLYFDWLFTKRFSN